MTSKPKPEGLAVGDKAPGFSLLDEHGTRVTLEGLKGKNVVLVFYPGDLTPGCTMQLCAIRDDWAKFREAGILVYGVNHADAASHQKFIDAYHYPFPLLIDTDKKVSEAYGALKKFFKAVVIKRSVVGIGPDGIVRFLKRGMPKDTEILKAFTK
jgi:peroxiredoxin Q/BCP